MIAAIILAIGPHAGVLADMWITEIRRVATVELNGIQYRLVPVLRHKTSQLGPVDLALRLSEYEALLKVCKFVEQNYPGAYTPFISLGSSEEGLGVQC